MIKIFIGTEPKTEIARKVLQYSILKNTKLKNAEDKIEFIPMMGDNWREVQLTKHGTGFSLLRWRIPEDCNYEGAAIYLDADILCLGDIVDLYQADGEYPNENASTWCCYYKSPKIQRNMETPETSVMLIDCAKAKTTQPTFQNCVDYANAGTTRENYFKVMRALKHNPLPQRIPTKFNKLNEMGSGETVLLHYTKEPEQPWYKPNHPHAELWGEYLQKAIMAGMLSKEEVEQAIDIFEPHTKQKRGQGMNPEWRKVL